MRLRITKCKNTDIFYVIKTIYVNGKQKTKTVERIGNTAEVKQKSNGEDPYIWAKKYVDELNKKEQEGTREILIKKSQTQLIDKDKKNLFNCGYFFLEKIYYGLQLDKICESITNKYQFKYDLNSILSRLIYGRIIFPSSKLAINELSKKFIKFGDVKHGRTVADASVELANIGDNELVIRAMEWQSKALKCSLKAGDRVAAGGKTVVKFTLDTSEVDYGVWVDRVRIITDDPSRPMQTLRVTAVVVE